MNCRFTCRNMLVMKYTTERRNITAKTQRLRKTLDPNIWDFPLDCDQQYTSGDIKLILDRANKIEVLSFWKTNICDSFQYKYDDFAITMSFKTLHIQNILSNQITEL